MRNLILIEGAMDIELNILLRELKFKRKVNVNHYKGYIGLLGKKRAVILQTEVGMVNASISTTLAIKRFRPSLVINQGTIGAYLDDLHTFDFIIPTSIINTEFSVGDEKLKSTMYDKKWIKEEYLNVDEEDLALTKFLKNQKGRIVYGRISSSDQWNVDNKRIKKLRDKYQVIGEEMESFASLSACKILNTPCLCIRVVSNNELTGEKFNSKTSEHLQREIIKFINN